MKGTFISKSDNKPFEITIKTSGSKIGDEFKIDRLRALGRFMDAEKVEAVPTADNREFIVLKKGTEELMLSVADAEGYRWVNSTVHTI